MGTKSKSLTLVLVALFLISIVVIPPTTVKATSPKTIVVPDDYPTIQSAVGNASSGDTVFVKKGTYDVFSYADSIILSKSIKLVGEDPKQTIINGHCSEHLRYPYPL